MILIFGIDRVNKPIGPIEEKLCPNCSNRKHWILQKTGRIFSLFFIPLIPFSSKFSIFCPICNFSLETNENDLPKYREMANLNNEALNGNLSHEEYEQKLNKL